MTHSTSQLPQPQPGAAQAPNRVVVLSTPQEQALGWCFLGPRRSAALSLMATLFNTNSPFQMSYRSNVPGRHMAAGAKGDVNPRRRCGQRLGPIIGVHSKSLLARGGRVSDISEYPIGQSLPEAEKGSLPILFGSPIAAAGILPPVPFFGLNDQIRIVYRINPNPARHTAARLFLQHCPADA